MGVPMRLPRRAWEALTSDPVLHIAGGALLSAPLLPWQPDALLMGGLWTLWGWLREGAQHRDEGAWVGWWWNPELLGMTDAQWVRRPSRIRWHRILEGAEWGIGALWLHLVF